MKTQKNSHVAVEKTNKAFDEAGCEDIKEMIIAIVNNLYDVGGEAALEEVQKATNKFYKELGGLDKNFISLVHHWDVMMRVKEMGGQCVLSNDKFYECPPKKEKHVELSSVTGRIDKKYFHELWWCHWDKAKYKSSLSTKKYKNKQELKESGDLYYVTNGRGYIPKNRQRVFESFDDLNILTKSQGRVYGKWDKSKKEIIDE